MIPLLPIPVTTTRPPHESRHSTARTKSCAIGPSMRSANSRSASASMRTTLEPVDFTRNIVAEKNSPQMHADQRRLNLPDRLFQHCWEILLPVSPHLKDFENKFRAIFGNFGISGNVLICGHQRKSAATLDLYHPIRTWRVLRHQD